MKKLFVFVVCSLFLVSTSGIASAASAAQATSTVTANVQSVSSIALSSTTTAFGTLAGSGTTYRFRKPGTAEAQLAVSYFAAGSYEIRVYTDNGVGTGYADARGFIRDAATVAANRLYLKAWCPNFNANKVISATVGPTFSTTSSQTQYLWAGHDFNNDGDTLDIFTSGTFDEAALGQDLVGDGDINDTLTATTASPIGESASLSYIREFDKQSEGDNAAAWATRCVLAYNTPIRGDASLANPFPVFFAVDVNGVKNGTYTSANNTVPIVTGQTATAGVIFDLFLY